MTQFWRTQGIVIDSVSYGEADGIFRIFSKDYGLISVMAKAYKKGKSNKTAFLQTGAWLKFNLIQKENRLAILQQVSSVQLVQNLSYPELVAFSNMLKCLKLLNPDSQVSERVWQLIQEFWPAFAQNSAKRLLSIAF